ncbi:hypothetical protein ET33_31325 [Paenibacillus tyrfis]|uniref:Uncharacterized protein n=1 Tax=Paenibacillus tyrfis TaxID=1501230 RepID=A0A081P6N7_9BACL|nr:hypothetical protein ET33_31325 [Paenibacillus tyrfis]
MLLANILIYLFLIFFVAVFFIITQIIKKRTNKNIEYISLWYLGVILVLLCLCIWLLIDGSNKGIVTLISILMISAIVVLKLISTK